MVSEFATQFVKMEEENARLKTELAAAKASAEEAKKLAADARLKADLLEKEKGKLKKSLEKELKAKELAKTATEEREEQLRQAVESLLSKFFWIVLCIFAVASDLLKVVLIASFVFQLLPILPWIELIAFELSSWKIRLVLRSTRLIR